MKGSIKRRQTLMANWLYSIGCSLTCIADSGSIYIEYNSQSTCKSIVRISNHLSNKKEHIHCIFTPLNTIVTIIYKNFIWNGSFKDAKQILYTLVMSKQIVESVDKDLVVSVNGKFETIRVVKNGVTVQVPLNQVKDITKIRAYKSFGGLKEGLRHLTKKYPESILDVVKFIKDNGTEPTITKLERFELLKKKYEI